MEMEKRLNLIKSTIQSLLISSTQSMDVRSLQKDFYQNFGENIPYKDFGYPTVISFLESLHDILKLCGNDSSALIIPCVSKNSAHIEQMMQKQKKKVTGKFPPRPRAILTHKSTVNDLKPVQSRIVLKNNYNSNQISKETFSKQNQNKSNKNERRLYEYTSQNRKQFPKDDNINFKNSTNIKYNESKIDRDFVKRSSEQNINLIKSNKTEKLDVKVLKDQLRNLISVYSNGIWCGQLPVLYKHKYKCDLDISCTGYSSISQYCASIPDVFQIVRSNCEDFLLYDARFPIENNFEVEESLSTDSSEKLFERKEKALPAFDYAWESQKKIDHMSDVVLSADEIPRQWIDDIVEEFVLIKVGQIYDPSVFWIILDSDKCSQALSTLMDHLQCFYATQNVYYQIPKDFIAEGLVCASLVLNEWHRGIIIRIIDDFYVKVFYFDYGSVEIVPNSDLRYLASEFKHLPQQAIRARLLNIVPYYNDYWSEESCEIFLKLVHNKSLYGSSIEVDEQMRVLSMVLIDTSGEDDVIINEYLCKNLLAVRHFQNKVNDSDYYFETDSSLSKEISISISNMSEITINDHTSNKSQKELLHRSGSSIASDKAIYNTKRNRYNNDASKSLVEIYKKYIKK